MGDSPRQEATNDIYGQISNYKAPYSPDQLLKKNQDFYKLGANEINKSFGSSINRNTNATAQRLAGQGIKGGATYEDTIKASNNPIYANKSDALTRLESSKAGSELNILDKANTDKISQIMLQLRAAGLLSDSNTWDDILGGVQTIGNLASGAGALGWKPFGA